MTKTKPPTYNSIVSKDNSLMPQLSRLDLSELRLLSYCLSHYDPRKGTPETYEEQKNKEIKASVKDLLEIFSFMDDKSAYAVVKKAVFNINSKPYYELRRTKEGNLEDIFMFWFSEFRYLRGKGEFTFCLSPKIVDKVLNLDANFTMFRLKDVYQFRSATTWKMYEILKQWFGLGKWSVNLDELKFLLGVAGKYAIWGDFKKRIIDPSLKEINKLSDIFVEYNLIKSVRKITGINFSIKTRSSKKIINYSEILEGKASPNIKLLINAGLNQVNAINLCDLAVKANKDIKVFFDRINNRYENKAPGERLKYKSKQAYLYNALYQEFTPLLDQLEPSEKEKLAQKKQVNENNKYGIEAVKCTGFELRTKGIKCKDENPNTKKCKACSKIIFIA